MKKIMAVCLCMLLLGSVINADSKYYKNEDEDYGGFIYAFRLGTNTSINAIEELNDSMRRDEDRNPDAIYETLESLTEEQLWLCRQVLDDQYLQEGEFYFVSGSVIESPGRAFTHPSNPDNSKSFTVVVEIMDGSDEFAYAGYYSIKKRSY